MDYDFNAAIEKAIANTPDTEVQPKKIEPATLPALPERHKAFEPIQSTSKGWSATYEALCAKIYNGITLALIGQRGCGKSQLGVCLIKTCCKSGRGADYKKAFEIFLRVRTAGKTDGASEMDAVAEFLRPFLLVIDAFEVRGDTPFENRVMDYIIDKRYDSLKTTIIISNDTREGLVRTLGESISDRMREAGGIVEMNWPSFRCKK